MSEITVVIPVWDDYQQFLKRALASIEEQDVACEILVYDNGSESPVALPKGMEHALGKAKIRILRSETMDGIGVARNKALAEVRTEFVAFHDADDLLLPGALTFALGQHERRYMASVALQSLCGDGEGHYWRPPTPVWQPIAHHVRPLLVWRSLETNLLAFGGCCVLRSSCIRDAGGFSDIPRGEEMPLNITLAMNWPCRWYRRFGRLYLIRPGSLWHRKFAERELRSMHEARLRPLEGVHGLKAALWRARLRRRADKQIRRGVDPQTAPGKELEVSLQFEAWARQHL
jgi:glycosyltransferase involved in cell wall biosynthesis